MEREFDPARIVPEARVIECSPCGRYEFPLPALSTVLCLRGGTESLEESSLAADVVPVQEQELAP